MKIKAVVEALERFAPLPLQEDYDNAGLQVGLTEAWEVSGALLCLDVTEKVVDEAVSNGCNLIVSHHPLIFHRLSHVTDEDFVQRIIIKAIENKIAIVSMHTNMDNAWGGVNFKMAEKMGLQQMDFIGDTKAAEGVTGASAVMGTLPAPMKAEDFLEMVKETFDVACIQANEPLQRPVSKVAVSGGSGAFMMPEAIKAGADAFVTGEMHYHDFFDHEQQLQIAVIGHYQSEQFTPEIFKDIIETHCQGVSCHFSRVKTNPIHYIVK